MFRWRPRCSSESFSPNLTDLQLEEDHSLQGTVTKQTAPGLSLKLCKLRQPSLTSITAM